MTKRIIPFAAFISIVLLGRALAAQPIKQVCEFKDGDGIVMVDSITLQPTPPRVAVQGPSADEALH